MFKNQFNEKKEICTTEIPDLDKNNTNDEKIMTDINERLKNYNFDMYCTKLDIDRKLTSTIKDVLANRDMTFQLYGYRDISLKSIDPSLYDSGYINYMIELTYKGKVFPLYAPNHYPYDSEEEKRYQLSAKILNFIKSNKIISDFGDIAKYIGEHDLLEIMITLPKNKSITLKFEDIEICVKKISRDILELYLDGIEYTRCSISHSTNIITNLIRANMIKKCETAVNNNLSRKKTEEATTIPPVAANNSINPKECTTEDLLMMVAKRLESSKHWSLSLTESDLVSDGVVALDHVYQAIDALRKHITKDDTWDDALDRMWGKTNL